VGTGGRVAEVWGFCGGSRKPLTGLADPARVRKSHRLPDPNDHFPVTQCHQGDLAGCSNSAPFADSGVPSRGQLARRSVRPYPALEGTSDEQRRTRSRYARAITVT